MWIITCRRFRQNRRGISNIIVISLSLVIILAIVSNIILWNYEMNQVDWEKMKEQINITNVEQITTSSSWIVTPTDFSVNFGRTIGGTYLDTQEIDGNYLSIIEEIEIITLINTESFEEDWPPSGWTETGRWNAETDYSYEGVYSADFDGGAGGQSGYLTSPSMDCSDAQIIYVDFWWYDRNIDDDDFELEYYNGSSWNNHQDLNQLESVNGWHHYTEVLTENQYFIPNFQVRWWAKTVWSTETGCIDSVNIRKSPESSSYSLDLNGYFNLNLSTYPFENIKTFEIQLRYRTNDSAEKWYLKAYDWNALTYSDDGFNSTDGHIPTTEWDFYTINFTDEWDNYIHNNGTISIKLVDQTMDNNKTIIDIDFLGIRVEMNSIQFTFKNNSGLTVHLVSLWIINSTDHQRHDINIFINSAETKNYIRYDFIRPINEFKAKVISERGNIAVYSVN